MNEQPQTENYTVLSTDELIERICTCGMGAPAGLAEAIVARGAEAVPMLCEIVSSPEWWETTGGKRDAAVIHAIHLLGAIGDPAAAPALLAPMTWDEDEDGDYLTEDMSGILARLGPEAIPAIREFVDNPKQDSIFRSVAYSGLVGMALLRPELRDRVKQIGTELAQRCLAERQIFPMSIALDLAAFGDLRDMALLKQIYMSDLKDDEHVCDWDDIVKVFKHGLADHEIKRATLDPMEYFAPEEQKKLRQEWMEWYEGQTQQEEAAPNLNASPKAVGRNAACPCGSGKKFKMCCGRV